jgi:hypothetical protein
MSELNLTDRAWSGKWLSPKRGILSLEGRRLAFVIGDELEFDVSLDELQNLTWHWYSFSAAFETVVHGKNYFLSFLGPGNTLSTWWQGIQCGRRWRAELTARMPRG